MDERIRESRGARGLALLLALLAGGALLRALARFFLWGEPVRQEEHTHPINNESPIPIPRAAQHGTQPLQLTDDGTGPLFHRAYQADILNPRLDAAGVMEQIRCEINDFCPPDMAEFEKIKGDPRVMQVGDEYDIHVTGPWDGPVRVIEVTPTRFSLLTLEGHFEAGEIRFRIRPHPTRPNALRFQILSWARSRDRLMHLAYEKLGVAKQAQTDMWVHFCQRVVEESGGELLGEIEVATHKQPFRGEVIPRE